MPETVPQFSVNNGIRRNAPDDGRYHRPSDAELSRMGLGSADIVVVPRGRNDGSSTGFDAHEAGVVHVDPEASDGGVLVDLAALAPEQMDAALAGANYPHQAYYRLGVKPLAKEANGTEQLGPSNGAAAQEATAGYVTPATDRGRWQVSTQQKGKSVATSTPQIPPAPVQPESLAHPAAHPAAAPPPYPYYPPTYDPNLQSMLAGLAAGLSQLNQRMDAMTAPSVSPVKGSSRRRPISAVATPLAEEDAAPTRHDTDEFDEPEEGLPRPRSLVQNSQARTNGVKAHKAPPYPDGAIAGFETLKIPCVDGPIANKPRRKALIDVGDGIHAPFYHDVVDAESCIVLIYDTRYEEGSQFLPAYTKDKPIRVNVPHIKKDYVVNSLGLAFSWGVFDFVILVKVNDEPEPGLPDELTE